jgi:hypothetical protein
MSSVGRGQRGSWQNAEGKKKSVKSSRQKAIDKKQAAILLNF